MSFRFRKSVNLGGGLRVNFSKSGVSYSWGTKGFRVTKTAKGKVRTTASIPGTGISYTQDFGGKKSRTHKYSRTSVRQQNITAADDNCYDTREIKNADAKTLVSEGLEEMLASANKALRLWNINSVVFFASAFFGLRYPLLFLVSAAGIAFGIFLKKNAVINIEYTFEDGQIKEVDKRIQPIIKMAKSRKVWWISQSSKVKKTKYAAGASSTVKREKCKVSNRVPFPFTTNADVVSFSFGLEKILFMPDKLFIIQGSKIGALNYSDVTINVHNQKFIESEAVPKDAKIVGYTWQYVNKSGGPDKRFQNNKKLPICLYKEMEVRSANGVNTDIIFSSSDNE